MMRNKGFLELAKFLGVGLVNTAVGLGVIYLMKWLFGLGDVAANAVGYLVGLVVSFTLNSQWTFRYKGPQLPAAVKFLLVAAVAYGMNLATVMTLIHGFDVNSYLAQALGIPPYTITSFLLSKFVVFRRRDPAD